MCLKGELTPDDWTKRKDKWRAVLLSIPASFRDFNDPEQPDQVWVQAFNRRQSVKQEHESMSRTAMQMAIEIDQFRTMLEALPGSKAARICGHGARICARWKKRRRQRRQADCQPHQSMFGCEERNLVF